MRKSPFPMPGIDEFSSASAGRSVTIMGLVEFDFALIASAELLQFKSHSFTDYEGE
jgi:hypothetical protein